MRIPHDGSPEVREAFRDVWAALGPLVDHDTIDLGRRRLVTGGKALRGPDIPTLDQVLSFLRTPGAIGTIREIIRTAPGTLFGSPVGLANANSEGAQGVPPRADHGHKRDVRVASAGVDVGTRNRLNFVSGATVADDAVNDEIDITISGGGGGGDNITVNSAAVVDADFDDATPAAPAGGINVKWQKDALSPANISANLAANDVSNTVLADMAGTTVKARSAGTLGDPGDLPASADGQFLRRSGGALVFGALTGAESLPQEPAAMDITEGATYRLRPITNNPRRTSAWTYDVFNHLGPHDNTMFNGTSFGAGGFSYSTADEGAENGVVGIVTGAGVNDGGAVAFPTAAAAAFRFDVGVVVLLRIKVPISIVSLDVFFGLADNVATTTLTDIPPQAASLHCGIHFNPATSANWRVRHSDGATIAAADYSPVVAVVADTLYTMTMKRVSATQIDFYIDNNAAMARTVNLPAETARMNYVLGGITRDAATKEARLSYVSFHESGLAR